VIPEKIANFRLANSVLGLVRPQDDLTVLVRFDLVRQFLELRIVQNAMPERGGLHNSSRQLRWTSGWLFGPVD
jgi:hypothetical protein